LRSSPKVYARRGTVKRYEKVLERLGRLRQNYSRAAQYYEVGVEQDPASGRATAIHWQRTTPIAERAEPRQQAICDALGISDRLGRTRKRSRSLQ
jgi:hypothetical protein